MAGAMRLFARSLCVLAVVASLGAANAAAMPLVPTHRQAPVLRRALTVEAPALAPTYQPGVAWEWQWDAANMNGVPDSVQHAAGRLTIAVIDSGADVSAPDLADKAPQTWSVLSRSHRVRDVLGHGTFVSSLAAGSIDDGVGIAGFGGDAKLLVVQAIGKNGYITDVDVAAAGNEHQQGNPVEYPAALMRGVGLAVGATRMDGTRAPFSNTGKYVSLVAPGENLFAAESADSEWPRAQPPWASSGYYGWASGTSFAAPEVAGAAALVWGANPSLTARQVATILEQSASGGDWSPQLGWGRLDAAAAVRLAP